MSIESKRKDLLRIVQDNRARLIAYARRFTNEAEDMVQAAFAQAWEKIDRFEPAPDDPDGSTLAWFYKILEREIGKSKRKRDAKFKPLLDELLAMRQSMSSSIGTKVGREFNSEELERALKRLQDNWRIAITLRHIEGKPVAEVAERLGITKAQTNAILNRALRRLIELLGGSDNFNLPSKNSPKDD